MENLGLWTTDKHNVIVLTCHLDASEQLNSCLKTLELLRYVSFTVILFPTIIMTSVSPEYPFFLLLENQNWATLH